MSLEHKAHPSPLGQPSITGNLETNSMPNLSRDILDNCLYHPYLTRDDAYGRKSTRRHSIGDVDYTEWSNRDFSDVSKEVSTEFQEANSQNIGKFKRILNISPSTPVGLQRKHISLDCSPKLRVITHGEDVEMVDLEQHELERAVDQWSVVDVENITTGRKQLKGRRRTQTDNLDSENTATKTGDVSSSQLDTNTAKNMSNRNNIKGMSINFLRWSNRKKVKKVSGKNYKSTRKKHNKIDETKMKIDKNQRLIHTYCCTKSNNKIIVGSCEADNDDGHDSGLKED